MKPPYPEQWGEGDEVHIIDKDVSGSTPVISDVIWLGKYSSGGAHLKTTGNLAGNWTIYGSLDYKHGQPETQGIWMDHAIATGSDPLPSADGITPQEIPLILLNLKYRAIKFKFQPTSGSGHLQACFMAK